MSDSQPAIAFRPIGVIRTPFGDTEGMPVQAVGAVGVRGRIELDPSLVEGLADLDGFSHLILIYQFHQTGAMRLTVTPFLDVRPHGVFATRSPARPNPIGISTVRLVAIEGSELVIEDVDILDGTPLLDMKPYVPGLDDRAGAKTGWYAGRLDTVSEVKADSRFR